MPMQAVEDVDDAYRATKALLWPIDRTTWLKLAVVVLFVAGPGGGFSGAQTSAPTNAGVPGGGPRAPGAVRPPVALGGAEWLVIGAIVGVVLLLVLGALFVGSVMEFVLVESLRTETVSLRTYWGRRWRQGLRLFGFRIVLGLLGLGSLAGVAGLVILPIAFDGGMGVTVPVLALLLLLPVLAVVGIVTGIVDGFTTVFVVPVMIHEERPLLGAWGRLWSSIVDHPWQYLTYVVVSVVLSLVGGVVAALAVGVLAVALLVPFGLLAIAGVLVATALEPLGIGIVVLTAVLFGLALIAGAAVVQVPVVVYLRYYALLVLGDVEESVDLIADRRAAVRATDGGSAPDGDDGDAGDIGAEADDGDEP